MRIVLILVAVSVAVVCALPETGGNYLPPSGQDHPSSRRHLPTARGRPRSSPPSRRGQSRGNHVQRPSVHIPDIRRPFDDDEIPRDAPASSDRRYLPTPDVTGPPADRRPPYEPSSAEVPPPDEAPLTYLPPSSQRHHQASPPVAPEDEVSAQHRARPPSHPRPTSTRRYVPPNDSSQRGNAVYLPPRRVDQQQQQQRPAHYDFEYKVVDAESGNDFGHLESRRGDMVRGKYRVLLPDGRTQMVEYVADVGGYQPVVTYHGKATTVSVGYKYNKPKSRF